MTNPIEAAQPEGMVPSGWSELLGAPEEWNSKLEELYGWTGSAWLAGETDEQPAGLYPFLCSLIGYLMSGHEAALLAASPIPKEADTAVPVGGVAGEPCTFTDCPPGLFCYAGMLCFKSEYSSKPGQQDAYCTDSGEYFWGGTRGDLEKRNALIVTPVSTTQPEPAPSLSGEVGGVLEALDEALRQFEEPMSALNQHELGERLAADVAEIVEHARKRAVLRSNTPVEQAAIPMLLFCPVCHLQHIDEPDERTPEWDNPPHRSHLCHGCGCIWRPADVATEGVASVKTVGKADTWTPSAPVEQAGDEGLREALNDYVAFAGEVAGTSLGLAMSTEHPAPDVALMGMFEKSQALAAKHRPFLSPSKVEGGR